MLNTMRKKDKMMRCSSSSATAAQTGPDDHRKTESCLQSVSDPQAFCTRAGVLRYNRESDNHWINLTPIPSEPLTECQVKCEYCGEKSPPSLDLIGTQEHETGPVFCCVQQQELYETLAQQKCLLECDPRTTSSSPPRDKPAAEMEELLFRGKEMEDLNKFVMDLPHGLVEPSELGIQEDYSMQLPASETSTSTSKVLHFRLSCAPKEDWIVCPHNTTEKHLETKEEEEVYVPLDDHKPLKFGMCHHQCGAEFLQKYYSHGFKFLTVFLDGSAQVFYPSGLLALIVVVTERHGRVCIVYDDSDASCQPVRAVFQSDGRATCYHSNGNIWLTLNSSGGQCLDEVGARVRRWSWGSPSPLHPIFLSLNKAVGVRVLRRERVFVSFLSRGQQAKFSVGTSCAQDECKTDRVASGPSVLKDELCALAARIRTYLAIQNLNQCLMKPSHPQLLTATKSPHLHVVAQRLLEISAAVMMSESERDFIYRCLQDCL